MQRKKNFDAANYNVPNVPIYSQQLYPNFCGRIDMEICLLFTTSYFKPHESICATYLRTEDNNCTKNGK